MAEAMISVSVPRFTRKDINEMRDQLLTMNLDKECLPSTGGVIEKRKRLMEHFYPTTPSDVTGPSSQYAAEQGPNVNLSASTNYSRTQINSLPVGPLKVALAALGLPFNGGVGKGCASLKAALYPPPVLTGTVSQKKMNPSPASQPSDALGTANYGSASQPILSPALSVEVGNNIQDEGREQWHLLTQTSGPVYIRIPVASRNKASEVYSTLL